MPKPLKRHPAIQPVSREHHHGLLLSWKIREGFKRNIDLPRIKKYVDWFYQKELTPHFDFEEKYLFALLDPDHPMIRRAMKEHRRLKRLFESKENPEKTLSLIEEELVQHIRFEERVLFEEIQKVASETQLATVAEAHRENKPESWTDPFWDARNPGSQ